MIETDHPTAPLARLRGAGRVLVLALLAAGLVAAFLDRGELDPASLVTTIGRYQAAPLVFLAIHVAASLLFIPRTMLAAVAGVLFGMWWGILWAALGSVVGAVAGFLVARYVNAGLLDPESMPRLGPVLLRAERGGWRAVAALRLVPVIPHSLANYALGLTRLRIGPYALGSLLGQLPMTVAYADFGAAGSSALAGKAGWLAPTLIGLAALALSLALPRLTRQPRPDLSGFVDPTPPQQGATGVEREVVKTIVETAGRHRLLIFRRDDGRFGFSAEEQTLDLDGRSCWTPSWPSDSPICDSSETAEREARARVPWLSGPP